MQDNLKNYVWTDDDHIADVFDETKTQPAGENGNQQPRRASSGSSSNFNVRTTLIGPLLFDGLEKMIFSVGSATTTG